MTGSVNKARVVLKAIRKSLDDLALSSIYDTATVISLVQINSELCDVLTMLVEEAKPSSHTDKG